MRKIKLTKEMEVIVDDGMYEELSAKKWFAQIPSKKEGKELTKCDCEANENPSLCHYCDGRMIRKAEETLKKLKAADAEEITPCHFCLSMTKTIEGRCGKCKGEVTWK